MVIQGHDVISTVVLIFAGPDWKELIVSVWKLFYLKNTNKQEKTSKI